MLLMWSHADGTGPAHIGVLCAGKYILQVTANCDIPYYADPTQVRSKALSFYCASTVFPCKAVPFLGVLR
eukprot:SAG22_NODE_15177_length_355_cov_0.609375_1_plen_69_part_10